MAYGDDEEAPESGPSGSRYHDEKTDALLEALDLYAEGDKRGAAESLATAIEMCVRHELDKGSGGDRPSMGPKIRGKKRAPDALILAMGADKE